MKKKKIYIAGKVTGLDREKCLEKFANAQKKIERFPSLKVVNPMVIVPEGTDWKKAMKICIKALVDCDIICLLDDWDQSKGAKLELTLATDLGLTVMSLPD